MSETVKAATSAELPAEYFDVQTNIPLIHQVVVAQQAAARQGTHSTKTRGEVRGGGAKPWRQKGTGRARQGSRRSPQWTGGGISHGPTPHGYAQRTPKKMIAAALKGALSDRARDGKVFILDSIVAGEVPSTKQALAQLAKVGEQGKLLVVLHRNDDVTWLSLRNVAEVHVLAVDQLNTYDVLVSDAVVFTAEALEAYTAGPAKGKALKAVATESEAAAAIATLSANSDEAPAAGVSSTYGEGAYEGTEPPAGYDIKGNADSMKFHTLESPYYSRTKAEVWFNSVEAAQAAGFVSASGDEGADDEETKK